MFFYLPSSVDDLQCGISILGRAKILACRSSSPESSGDFYPGWKGYVATGNTVNNSDVFKDVWRFDPQSNEWEELSAFPGEARGYSLRSCL
ncbi:MAG: hypothetical protein IPG87_01375 [Saprospiraceae bacterium]|nr:hypothetical protein [Candidatus Vicinibacter affinis]